MVLIHLKKMIAAVIMRKMKANREDNTCGKSVPK